ncbi:MFS transporter [Phreatobacter oligotrophus]|uniref:MFS transporter n=1 Tax=Phreatobacter oligotrophus TaxID=1122261 RepID=UPI0023524F6C|nr:MFS transporter [Phreatobacter oligotrophus]MBX9992146.1 PucC family protein [Phreatobacter oligotrophus]
MNPISQRAMQAWVGLGPRFLPFADAASADVPLSRLLRLSLVQVSVGMSLVLMVGTLNRVMIVELGISAALVSTMIALPVLFAPLRAYIGQSSDTHVSVLGWKRVPFLFNGSMVQFGGLSIMPFALLVLSGGGASQAYPQWVGQAAAALSFLLVGAGIHITQTVGLALATDLTSDDRRPKVVGLMYVSLLAGSIASALVFGQLLEDFTPGRLIQVIQGTAVLTLVLNGIALWKQESLKRVTAAELAAPQPRFTDSMANYMRGGATTRRLVAVGLGTMAFGMQDVLLEPYGGEILGLTVADTTKLTAALAAGGLVGFAVASHLLSRGADAYAMAGRGALIGSLGLAAVILASPFGSAALFVAGVILVGLGGGLFGHGTLTAAMNAAPEGQVGLALGAWGAMQATAAGVGIALGGLMRDVALSSGAAEQFGAAFGYMTVYTTEILLLLVTFAVMSSLFGSGSEQTEGSQGAQHP